MSTSLRERFLAKAEVDLDGPVLIDEAPCWNWTAAIHRRSGYGRFAVTRRETVSAHCIAYILWYGPIPPSLEIDHLCRNRRCVNPAHLQAVTHRENVRRALRFSRRWPGPPRVRTDTHCAAGHEFTVSNTYRSGGKKKCRECQRKWSRDHYWRNAGHGRA